MTISDYDPILLSSYTDPRFLLHLNWQKTSKVYRYALVEIIEPKEISSRSKQKIDEIGLTQEEIWKKKYAKNNSSIK